MAVHVNKIKQFEQYCKTEKLNIFLKIKQKKPSVVSINNYSIDMLADSQFTLVDDVIREYDITSKDWGFYLTPSFFGRCKNFGIVPFFIMKKNDFDICLIAKHIADKMMRIFLNRKMTVYSIEGLSLNKFNNLIEGISK